MPKFIIEPHFRLQEWLVEETPAGFAKPVLDISIRRLEYGRIQVRLPPVSILIITEKTSQARDLHAALGDRFGQILPAEGHLLRLAEPHEVEASWRSWACVLLKPEGLYPTKPATEGSKPAKLKAIAAALARCDRVILGVWPNSVP